MIYHNPVLLNECIYGLNIASSGVYVDATFGGGGHSKAIIPDSAAPYSLTIFEPKALITSSW